MSISPPLMDRARGCLTRTTHLPHCCLQSQPGSLPPGSYPGCLEQLQVTILLQNPPSCVPAASAPALGNLLLKDCRSPGKLEPGDNSASGPSFLILQPPELCHRWLIPLLSSLMTTQSPQAVTVTLCVCFLLRRCRGHGQQTVPAWQGLHSAIPQDR